MVNPKILWFSENPYPEEFFKNSVFTDRKINLFVGARIRRLYLHQQHTCYVMNVRCVPGVQGEQQRWFRTHLEHIKNALHTLHT